MLSFSSLADDLSSRYLLVDTCATLTHRKFSKDLDAVVSRFHDSGVQKTVLRATNASTSRDALRLCRLYPDKLFCCAGFSPHESRQWTEDSLEEMRSLLSNPECVALGEIGLDFEKEDKTTQMELFETQLQLASSLQSCRPVVVVVRNAHQQTADVISRFASKLPFLVIHSFCGSRDDCLRYLNLAPNIFIGLSGVLCKDKCDVTPLLSDHSLALNRILLESDSPWNLPNTRSSRLSEEVKSKLTERSQQFLNRYCTFQRNEPCSLPAVAELVAALSGVSPHEVALQTTYNALKVFGLTQ